MQKTLGEVWIPGQDSEVTYTGEDGSSMGIQYIRNKVREFQATLNAVDAASVALQDAIGAIEDDDFDTAYDLMEQLNEYESKKGVFRTTAEAINLAASGINALGGRMPELSIPTGLGLPIVIPLALVAAIGTAAALIVWGNTWLQGVQSRMQIAVEAGLIQDPEKRDAFIAKMGEIQRQADAASGSGLSNIASIVKWGAIAFAGYLAFQAFQSTRSHAS